MMNLVRNLSLTITCLLSGMLYGQTLIVVINPIVQVPVGTPVTVSGTVSHDPATAAIPAGTVVITTIQILDPSGNQVLAAPPIEDEGGFSIGEVKPFTLPLGRMEWSEDDKWNPTALWNASVSVSSPLSALVNATESFPLLIADLTLQVNGPANAAPGDFVDLTGVVRNLAAVQTEPGVFFKVEAYIPNTNFTHSVVFPPAGSWDTASGDPWPIGANMDNNFTIPDFYIPPDTPDGPLQITVEVDDPDPVVLGVPIFEVIHEQDDLTNNVFTHTINIVSGDPNLQPSTDFLINGGLEGTYQGLDAVRCTVSIRNVGTGPVATGNAFVYRVFLSNDTIVSNDDFLLRQVDLGSTGLGNGLLPNESITLDWIQMLPDNFEGDYYVIADLNGVLLNVRTTPSLTLRSENTVDMERESGRGIDGRTSRPSCSENGYVLSYEVFDGNVSRLLLKNVTTQATLEMTAGINAQRPNGSSYAPKVSADGRFVVFHSFAKNLLPGDKNGHADIYRYDVHEARLVRITTGSLGEANGGSYYPAINEDGSKIVFETHATNLDPGAVKGGKQIMLWSENQQLLGSGSGNFSTVTNGNADSFDASISGDGTRIVFTTHATDLVAGETDDNAYPDVVLWENGNFYYAGRAEDGNLPKNGETNGAEISVDGKVMTFVSSARNMVSGKGIAHILIEDAGVGYPADSTVLINDVNGSGANVRISTLNAYGEIVAFAIDNPGRNYVNPTLTIATPATGQLPDRNVSAIPLLVNPEGDVFRITVDAVKSGGGSERVSESPPLDGDAGSETGGNTGSREPSISRDGSFVAYSTRSSNLQDLNVTSTNVKTFANHRFRPATAQAVLHWTIGSVIITNPGSGYLGRGSVEIVDLSGGGSGAVATYSVLQTGQIGSITIVNPGSGYNLSTTTLSIQNDNTGSGFSGLIQGSPGVGLGANRTGGATIHRIEMVDTGTGYPSKLNLFLESPEILVDGDGADLDLDGKPDARLNPDRLFTASDGKVYLEQQIDITIKNRLGLIGSSLSIGDANQTIVFSFASTPQGANVLGVDFDISGNTQTDTKLRNDLIAAIKNFWSSPTDISAGPLIENNVSGGDSFTLRVLNGTAVSNNPSSLLASFRSNMLIGGSGYTRATPFITPSPSVIGFSEVQTGTSSLFAPNGRPIFDARDDLLTDDIYYYDHNFSQNTRISVSNFGFPTNYLAQATLPSHRYPSLSGNGRFVFFSSDAEGLGGLIFDTSNRLPLDTNDARDIYKRDMKKQIVDHVEPLITVNTDLFDKTNYIITHGQQMPVIVDAVSFNGYLSRAELYVDGTLESSVSNTIGLEVAEPRFYQDLLPDVYTNKYALSGTTAQKARFMLPFVPDREGYMTLEIMVHDTFGNVFKSKQKIDVKVEQPEPEVMSGRLSLNPNVLGRYSIIIIQRSDNMFFQSWQGRPNFAPMPAPVHGPYTESQIDYMKVIWDPITSSFNDAYFESDSPLNHRQLDDIYPQRLRITRGSTLNARADFVSGYGKRSDLEKVVFYLNGDFYMEDTKPPFAVTFKPPLLADDNVTILNSWSISAHAIPINNGRSFMVHRFGESFTEVVLPEAKLNFTDPDIVSTGVIHDGDRVSLQVTVTGESESLKSLMDLDGNGSDNKRVHFIINGVLLSSVSGVPVIQPSGEYTQVDFYAMLNADFTQFAEPDGSIEIQALGEMAMNNNYTPVYASNTLKLKIKAPMPWLDQKSAGISIFRDLSESNMTKEQQARMEHLFKTEENGLAKWVDQLTDRASFSDRVSIMAAYHISMGEWHESYFDLEHAIELVDLNASSTAGIMRLKRYINEILTSVRYEGKFGSVPYQVGSFSMSNTFNFDVNRRSFVEQSLTNKYSYLENEYTPAFQQLFQGSQRMLTRWGSFEPDYWELPSFTGTPPRGAFDSPPRRDALTANAFAAGECAVDLIYNLANETKMSGVTDGSANYIVYSENIRETIYRTATLMSLLWRSKAFPLNNAQLIKFSELPFDQVIQIILEDHRYSSRFNLIWRDSQPVIQGSPDWKNESWFGNFYDKHFPWIYHEHLGWLYMAGVTPYEYWFHHQTLGWLWTGNKHYPQVYSNNEQNWIYLYPENKAYYSHGSRIVKSF
jgi:hypothetical protein